MIVDLTFTLIAAVLLLRATSKRRDAEALAALAAIERVAAQAERAKARALYDSAMEAYDEANHMQGQAIETFRKARALGEEFSG